MACKYQPACPGCPAFGEAEIAVGARARLSALSERLGGPEVTFFSAIGFGSRARARLSVRGRAGALKIGIFEARSHRLVAIPDCPLHHPAITSVIEALTEIAHRASLAPYDEQNHSGVLRTVQLVVERQSGTVQVVLVARASHSALLALRAGSPQGASPELGALYRVASELSQHPKVHSVFLNAQPERTNTLLGPEMVAISGPPMTSDRSGSLAVFYPPDAFGQANPDEHDRAIAHIFDWIPKGSRVREYYAGVGSIGLGLLGRGDDVRFNELGPGSLRGLAHGLAQSKVPGEGRICPGRAGDVPELVAEADVVIVDPPRKGLDAPLLDALIRVRPVGLIYLSCGLDSFERDAERLVEGGFELQKVLGMPYFPFTEHVETLALFWPVVPGEASLSSS